MLNIVGSTPGNYRITLSNPFMTSMSRTFSITSGN